MHIPYDGDPPPAENSSDVEEEPEWDDPDPSFEHVRSSAHPVVSEDVKVIVFDLFGTIFVSAVPVLCLYNSKLPQNRETAVREALQSIIQADWGDLTPRQLVAVYMECEALQSKQQPDAAYVDIARGAFKDVGMRLGFNVSEGALDQSIQCLLQPRLYPDGVPAIAALHARGYKILGFSSLDAHTFTRYFQRSVPAEVTIVHPSPTCTPLYSPNPQLFPDLLSHCRCGDEEIQTAQILVVTAAPYRTAEPANTSGFSTALIKRAGELEPNVDIDTAAPTLIIDGLSQLYKVLESVPLCPPEPAINNRIQRFRINGLYQSTKPLGYGSFGEGDCFDMLVWC
jgi:FMN phosphatase YigB (HAD superfamily)